MAQVGALAAAVEGTTGSHMPNRRRRYCLCHLCVTLLCAIISSDVIMIDRVAG